MGSPCVAIDAWDLSGGGGYRGFDEDQSGSREAFQSLHASKVRVSRRLNSQHGQESVFMAQPFDRHGVVIHNIHFKRPTR